jgi:hypothetical protein
MNIRELSKAPALLLLLFTIACAWKEVTVVEKFTFPGPYKKAAAQGMAVYENTLFLLNNGGHCRIYDLKSKELVADFDLESADKENHCNSASFGIAFPEGNKEFPAFYVSECYGERRCFVESVTRNGSRLIQTLSLGTEGAESKSFDWVVDRRRKCLYAIAIASEELDSIGTRKYLITKLPLPSLDRDNIVFKQNDIIEQFEITFPNLSQGASIHGDYLYLPVGLHDYPAAAERPHYSHRDIIIVNLKTKKVAQTIDIHHLVSGEPEDMDFYNGNIILYCGQQDGGVYMLSGSFPD